MRPPGERVIDMHFHVGLLGDSEPRLGMLSDHFRRQSGYKVFLAYARVREDQVCDRVLRDKTEEVIDGCGLVDQVVCLALDPVYDLDTGERREDRSHMWVDNGYVLQLRKNLPDRVLLGASVHPYDPDFKDRVRRYVDEGAVLLKWIPSAQAIDLAHPKIGEALQFLATVGAGDQPLPLLLHCGPEYAVPPAHGANGTADFLSWSFWDRVHNTLRFRHRHKKPDVDGARTNLRVALDRGATIIFAHCGFPYFATGPVGKALEHSDYRSVRGFLTDYSGKNGKAGRCFADVSACCTPFRKTDFHKIHRLPAESLLFGSDFPTPVFELSADIPEIIQDFRAVLDGHIDRIIIPEDNLVDVNYRELQYFFPGHPLFKNFNRILPQADE